MNELSVILPQTRIDSMRRQGHWRDLLLTGFLDRWVAEKPEATAIVTYNSATGQRTAVTYGALHKRSMVAASLLAKLGVRKGDRVSFQLPNWWQFAALHIACLRLGAVSNPLVMIFRERELEFMLNLAESRILITTPSFRSFDHGEMARELKNRCERLEHVGLVDEDALRITGGDVLMWDGEEVFAPELAPLSADDFIQLMYTSGTTGEPKGVMHTSNTLFSNLVPYAQRLGITREDVILMGSPLAHQTGFLYGLLLPLMLGCRSVLMDVWNGNAAAEIIEREGVTFSMGSTPFLSDLTGVAEQRPEAFRSLRYFHSAGAPIPRPLLRDARGRLGAAVLSGWGMTENGCVTMTRPEDAPEKAFETDGCCLPGMEIRTVDLDGNALPPEEEGRLQVRGCSNFVGYLKRPQLHGTDAQGWFETGDLGRIDKDGYLRITGRAKDIIIRGGENVPVVEIEGLLFTHPKIGEVAIVGMPHPRLGETGCAFVVPAAGESVDLDEVTSFLLAKGVSKSYLPETLVLADALPKTPSGKVQKFVLRERAAKQEV